MYRVVRFRALVCALALLISTPSQLLFADNATSPGAVPEANSADKNIVVLQTFDPEPASAIKLQTIRVGGDEPSETASLTKLIASAKELALKSDANVIKITEQKARSKNNICDHIVATLYKVDNPHAYETGFAWTPGRRLDWDDFRGPQQPYSEDNVAAATFCSIGFETNTISRDNNKLKVNVFNTFYTTRSWVRNEERDERLLAHEQGHFDLCELYTRKLRQRMADISVDVNTLSGKLKGIYHQLQDEYQQRQELYEDETNHGLITAAQARWQKMIENELEATAMWQES